MGGGALITRRASLALGASAAAPLVLGPAAGAGAGTALAAAAAKPPPPGSDAEVLQSAAGLEQVSAFAYRTLARTPGLDPALARTLRRFARQEAEHAGALRTALEALGTGAPREPRSVADADRVLPGLGEARTRTDVLTFAIELETTAVATYHDAVRRLADRKLLQTAAAIMACEGQHLAVLRRALREDPVPHALETGAR